MRKSRTTSRSRPRIQSSLLSLGLRIGDRTYNCTGCCKVLFVAMKAPQWLNKKRKYTTLVNFSSPFLFLTLGTFRSEYEYDYEYEFSVLSTRIRFRGRHFSKCACSERKTRTRSRTRTPI